MYGWEFHPTLKKNIPQMRLFWLLLLLPFCGMSQSAFFKFKVSHWDSRNGMPNDISLNLFQTRDGFIWLSGYSGLIRFDGAEFTTFNSNTDSVFRSDGITSVLFESPDSALWVATPGSGLLRMKNGKLRRLLEHSSSLNIFAIVGEKELVLGLNPASSTFILFNIHTFQSIDLNKEQSDSARKYWSAHKLARWITPSTAVRLARPGSFRLEQQEIQLDDESVAKQIPNSLLHDSKGRLWSGSDVDIRVLENGVWRIPAGLTGENIIQSSFTRSQIIEDGNGGIWVGTKNGIAYSRDGIAPFVFYDGGGMQKVNNVQGLLKDREGNIWVGSDRGLFKFSPSKVTNVTEYNGLVNARINSINEVSAGKFLLVTRDNKLYNYSNNQVRAVSADSQQLIASPKEIYYLYTDSKKQLWIGANGLLYMWGKGKPKKWELGKQVRYITEGQDGQIYLTITAGGLARIDERDSLVFLKLTDHELMKSFLSSGKQRKNGDWVVTSYSGAIIIGNENKPAKVFSQIDGVGGVQVFCSYEDAATNLWLPTVKGLAVLRAGKDSLEIISTKDGMPYAASFDVLEDRQGYFWLPTNQGVMKASRAELLAHLDDRQKPIQWRLLDESDGMVNRQFVGARHSIVGTDQKFYFPNISGMIVINPEENQKNTFKPQLAINGINVDGKFYPPDTNITIPPGDHRYLISYSALSFYAPEKTQIKFRLVGYDKDWIFSKGDRRAIYTNLPPGEHIFEMTAANNDGVWADAPLQLHFIVEPRFYQTLWFRLLGMLLLLGLIWLVIRWRTSATRNRNQELEKEVGKRTQQISRQKQELEQMVDTLKSTQKQLIQQEKMASLGELTAGIAHEIQNPLNFINNFSDLNKELIEEIKAEPDEAERNKILEDINANLDKVLFHGKRADSIVKSMLQHSHSKTGDKEPTDINALADEYLRLSFHGLRAKDKSFQSDFSIEADPSIGQVPMVRQDISRVLLNIINNAFYSVHQKASQSNESYKPFVKVTTKNVKDSVQISIEDNGEGIPENIQHKIFQPFFTTKPTGQGTGLGLSLSYDIVKSHGGDIQVESKKGEGTCFTISIPR